MSGSEGRTIQDKAGTPACKQWIAVVGPTGSGKSALAMELALALGGEIIGCDSIQLYRGFDIGSAKPTVADRAKVPHHVFDLFEWHEDCDAARYASLARTAIDRVRDLGRIPIVTGGTGLYLRALLGGGWNADLPKDEALRASLSQLDSTTLFARLEACDPERAQALHPNDRFRVIRALELVTLLGKPLREAGLDGGSPGDKAALVVVLDPPRAALHERIARRTAAMLEQGLLHEVTNLLQQGVSPDCKPMGSIGYKQACAVLLGRAPEANVADAINAATRQYAKRQCTWFRKVAADLRIASGELGPVLEAAKHAFG